MRSRHCCSSVHPGIAGMRSPARSEPDTGARNAGMSADAARSARCGRSPRAVAANVCPRCMSTSVARYDGAAPAATSRNRRPTLCVITGVLTVSGSVPGLVSTGCAKSLLHTAGTACRRRISTPTRGLSGSARRVTYGRRRPQKSRWAAGARSAGGITGIRLLRCRRWHAPVAGNACRTSMSRHNTNCSGYANWGMPGQPRPPSCSRGTGARSAPTSHSA